MIMKINEKQIVKEKVEFVKSNAIKIYFMKEEKIPSINYTVEESITSILLSDKPLLECRTYEELNNTLQAFDSTSIKASQDDNYALKVIFLAARYINSAVKPEESEKLRNKLRRYSKQMDGPINAKGEILLGPTEQPILKKIK